MKHIFHDVPKEESKPNHQAPLDVIIVGAGPAGIGVALMLTRTFGVENKRVLVVERGEGPGESFKRWPKEMRFISPSFNHQGWTKTFDLNSVAFGTSPAFHLGVEHPSGEQYAFYLTKLAKVAGLNIRARTEVTAVLPHGEDGFSVEISSLDTPDAPKQTLRSRYVIWAAGEYQYKSSEPAFPGAEHCTHNSDVQSWREVEGNNHIIIGGYESGMDAATNLAKNGKNCMVIASTPWWQVTTDDPSTELSPYTMERVRNALALPTPPKLLAPLRVFKVESVNDIDDEGGYIVHARWGVPNLYYGEQHRIPLSKGDSIPDRAQEIDITEIESDDDEEESGASEDDVPKEGDEIVFHHPILLSCAMVLKVVLLWAHENLFEFGSAKVALQDHLFMQIRRHKDSWLVLVEPAVRHGELIFVLFTSIVSALE